MKNKKKRILIITSEFPPQPGGIGNHAYHLALYLSKNNYSVKVIADQRSLDNAEEIAFDETLPFSVRRIKLRKFRIFMYFKRIAISLSTMKRVDLVIATGKFSLWNVAFCKFFVRIESIAVIHGSEVNFKSYLSKKAIDISLKKIDHIIAVSNYTKSLVSYLKKNVRVIPNGIDFNKWRDFGGREKKIIKGNPVLTTVGRVSKRKGQLQVIKQLPQLVKIYPDLHYHCVGISTDAKDFIKEAEILNVTKYITFHGAVSDLYLKNVLHNTDIFVMLSTESQSGDVEGFGIALLEANACKIPTIGSKGCGIEDAIKHGYSGFLIDKDDTKELIDSISKIIDNMEEFKSNSLVWAKEHNWDNIIKQYISIISCQH